MILSSQIPSSSVPLSWLSNLQVLTGFQACDRFMILVLPPRPSVILTSPTLLKAGAGGRGSIIFLVSHSTYRTFYLRIILHN